MFKKSNFKKAILVYAFLCAWIVISFLFKVLYNIEVLFIPFTSFIKSILFWSQQILAPFAAIGYVWLTRVFKKGN
jgi:hypothetical protein